MQQGLVHIRPRAVSSRNDAETAIPSVVQARHLRTDADRGEPATVAAGSLGERLERARRYGHSLDRLNALAGEQTVVDDPVSGGPPIQRLPTSSQLRRSIIDADGNDNNLFINQMSSALSRYHQQQQPGRFSFTSTHQRFADERSKALDQMEHAAYRWMDVNKRSPSTRKQHGVMMGMLDQIQQAHSEHIEYLHNNNLKLYTPDRDTMGSGEQEKLQSSWNELRNGTGLIKPPSETDSPQGARDLRAMHARLLSRPAGRELLYGLLDKTGGEGKNVAISAMPPITSTPDERKQRRDEKKRADRELDPQLAAMGEELARLTSQPGFPSLLGRKPERDHELGWDVGQIKRVRELRTQSSNLEQETSRIRNEAAYPDAADAEPTDKHAATATTERRGPGSGSRINVRTGLRDSELMNEDDHGNFIPAPAFAIYGHELIHALHNRQGNDRTGVDSDSYRVEPLARWDNREEHHTIDSDDPQAITENRMRAEHGLTRRKWHTGKTREEVEEDEAAA